MFTVKEVFLMGLAMGAISAYVAIRKKKNPITWFLVGFFFGIPGILFNFFLPLKKKASFQKPTLQKFRKSTTKLPFDKPTDRRLWYYLDQNHEQCGPMSLNALKEHWETKKIGRNTFVWNDELENWKKIEQLSDFEELFYGRSLKARKPESKITS